jgi:hypothetical protein
MTKAPNQIPFPDALNIIPGTMYVILPGNRVARLMTPTVKGDKRYYNLFLGKEKEYTRIDAEVLDTLLIANPKK